MMAMIIALQWVEEVRPERVVIEPDSCAALKSLNFCNPRSREDLLYEILQTRFQKSWDTVQIVNKKGMQ